ncbi:Helix-turn-helix domain [Chlamydia abortus]|uniref:ArsR/SmtB family transcription factor n=1 Tax=Paenibacillus residui TaxID=629724 RepID=A0ABW3D5N3_9BACL|nr:winged helix-turn-helix domain-containing protein [Paenibacillus sp. 32O-W]SHE12498.1 Helix-turn-helix domain [Chlamydia abortus]
MNQLPYLMIDKFDQLKALSDPFRARIVMLLIENSYTGQQLAQQLEIPRSKIHYHLNELEKNELIRVNRTEVKNGIIQKFYRSVARGFFPSPDLLPHATEVSDYFRESTISSLDRAKLRALSAPERAFQHTSPDKNSWPRTSMQAEVRATEEQFVEWLRKFRKLVAELAEIECGDEGNLYYISTVAFEIDEPWFNIEDENQGGLSFDENSEKIDPPNKENLDKQ